MVFTFATVTFFFAEDILVLLYKTSGELLEVGRPTELSSGVCPLWR